jgi:DNA-binding beta-propeller fold protein YncE
MRCSSFPGDYTIKKGERTTGEAVLMVAAALGAREVMAVKGFELFHVFWENVRVNRKRTGAGGAIVRGLVCLGTALLLGVPRSAPVTLAAGPPPAPQWIGIHDLGGKVGLNWVHNPGFARVRIFRGRGTEDEPPRLLGETGKNFHTDEDVVRGRTYVYFLVAVGPEGAESTPSSRESITLAEVTTHALSAPAWEGHLFTRQGVGLKWSSDYEEEIIAYNIYRKGKSESEYRLLASSVRTSYNDKAVERDQEYSYVVTALDAQFRESPFSGELSLRYVPPDLPDPGLVLTPWRRMRSRLVRIVTGGDRPFFRPVDVAVSTASGEIYVSDSGTNTIQAFTEQGRFLRSYGGDKSGGVAFEGLLGIALDREEHIYCVDSRAGRLVVLTRLGAPRKLFDDRKLVGAGVTGLIDAAVGPRGQVFLVDNFNNRVTLRQEGGQVLSIGGRGVGPGEFSAPTFAAADDDGFFYVSDALNGRVQVFDPSGTFVRSFGTPGKGPGGLGRPKGVAVNPRGEVFVADSWQNVIQVFDREGRFIALLTDEEGGFIDLGSPNGIALDSEGRIIIAERLSGRLQIREIIDEP